MKKTVVIELDTDLWRDAKIEAARQGIPVKVLVANALDAFLKLSRPKKFPTCGKCGEREANVLSPTGYETGLCAPCALAGHLKFPAD